MSTSQLIARSLCILLASCCIPGVSAIPLEARSDQAGSLAKRVVENLYPITNDTAAFITDNADGWWGVQAYVNTGVHCDVDIPPSFTVSWNQNQSCTDFGFDSSDNTQAVAAKLPVGWQLTLTDSVCADISFDAIYFGYVHIITSDLENDEQPEWFCYTSNNPPWRSFVVRKTQAG